MIRTTLVMAVAMLSAAPAFADSGVTTAPAQTTSERLLQLAKENKELRDKLADDAKQIAELKAKISSLSVHPDGNGKWEIKVGMTLEEATRIARASTGDQSPNYSPQVVADDGTSKAYEIVLWNGNRQSRYRVDVENNKITALNVVSIDHVSPRPPAVMHSR